MLVLESDKVITISSPRRPQILAYTHNTVLRCSV